MLDDIGSVGHRFKRRKSVFVKCRSLRPKPVACRKVFLCPVGCTGKSVHIVSESILKLMPTKQVEIAQIFPCKLHTTLTTEHFAQCCLIGCRDGRIVVGLCTGGAISTGTDIVDASKDSSVNLPQFNLSFGIHQQNIGITHENNGVVVIQSSTP